MKRRLTSTESDLWRNAVRDVRPLPQGTKIIETPTQTMAPRPGAARPRRVAPVEAARLASGIGASGRAGSRHGVAAPVFGGGDPALDRRLARRRAPIERVLDLHGMRQVSAHGALRNFIDSAHRDGARAVLVITGKGGAASAASMTRRRLHGDISAGVGAGVLRARFLDWIEEPDLRRHIARVSQAAPRDGGAGAFYVFLKA
ncbi:MAG: Smr/MutS family protein [Parvularculaceae bacterium]|nr:Smr/MutS family protein [Parvularculaceae bacterium]